MGTIVSAVALWCGRRGETTTLWSQSSNQSIMINPSGTKFSWDKIVPQSDLRAGTASNRIIKKEWLSKDFQIQLSTLYHHQVYVSKQDEFMGLQLSERPRQVWLRFKFCVIRIFISFIIIIQYSVWRQVQSLLQNDSSTKCDLALPPSNEIILSCP